jgi:hypothetical protein
MRLVWYQRDDGLWNAECACHATIAGVSFDRREAGEAWHFDLAGKEREHREGTDRQIPACGPKLPDPNPNLPGPRVFP